MKKYSNPTHKMLVVEFECGDAQFLMSGQSFITDRKTKKVQEGVVVKEVVSVKAATKKAPKKTEGEKQ